MYESSKPQEITGLNSTLPVFDDGSRKIVFPGVDGAPFRGNDIPNLKKTDKTKPQEVLDACVGIFKLNNSDHLREYEIISDNCVKGIYVLGTEDKQWVPEEKTWYVLLRYYKRFAEMPGENQTSLHKAGNHITYRGS